MVNIERNPIASPVITSAKAYTYQIPFVRPLVLKGRQYEQREGILLSCDVGQETFWGEASPLPGFSQDSLSECRIIARAVTEKLTGLRSLAEVENLLASNGLTPSIRFAVEMILLSAGKPALLPAPLRTLSMATSTVEVNALYIPHAGEPAKMVQDLTKKGFKTIKVKVGSQELEKDISMVNKLLDNLADDMTLRLDANRAWDIDDAYKFSIAVSHPGIEYIEEPLKDKKLLRQFINSSKLPVALDESLLELSLSELKELKGVRAFILKPTILGGFLRSIELVQTATGLDAFPVVSSTFESGLGMAALARFAATLPHKTAHGLDTLSYFSSEITSADVAIRNGSIEVPAGEPLFPLEKYLRPL